MALLMVKGSYQIPFGQRKRLLRSTAAFSEWRFSWESASGAAPGTHPSGDPFRHRRYGSDLRCPAPEGEVEIRDGESYGSQRFYWKWETEVKLFDSSGLRETGLVDPYFGKPVAVVEYQAVKELFNQKTKVLWIPYQTVGKQSGCLPGICLDCLFISRDGEEKKIDRPIVAVCKETLSAKGRYQMILPSALTDD